MVLPLLMIREQDETVQVGSKISSVYLDNAALEVYHERLKRDDMATLVRVRSVRFLPRASRGSDIFCEALLPD